MSLDTKVAGNWQQQSESNAIFANMGGSDTKLTLGEDHNFTLETKRLNLLQKGSLKTVRIEGTWKVADNMVAFTTSKVDGKPLEEFKKLEAEELSHIGSDFFGSIPAQEGSDGAAAKAQLQDMLQKAIDPKKYEVLIPESGELIETRTLTVNCQAGRRMEFGKLMSR